MSARSRCCAIESSCIDCETIQTGIDRDGYGRCQDAPAVMVLLQCDQSHLEDLELATNGGSCFVESGFKGPPPRCAGVTELVCKSGVPAASVSPFPPFPPLSFLSTLRTLGAVRRSFWLC